MKKNSLLIVDDEESIRDQMKWAFYNDYEILTANKKTTALNIVTEKKPEVITLDLGLSLNSDGATEGLELLSEIRKIDPFGKIIIITGNTEKDNALKGVSLGAYDYLLKPVNLDELKIIVRRAFYLSVLEKENKELQNKINKELIFEELLGASPSMLDIFSTIRKVAPTDLTILITGESGTGKELVARAIHQRSTYKEGAFVPVNCGAIPENLIESELFGHEKGSFTGAYTQRKGKIEMAHQGTIFFDEIGDLYLPLQVKLLRYLQEQTIDRVGGKEGININARVLAATNLDLEKAVLNNEFRDDLYYRLAVVNIKIPPLRERKDDLLLYAKVFLEKFCKKNERGVMEFASEAKDAIMGYHWPGNVRELENKIKRAVIMADGKQITARDLNVNISADYVAVTNFKEAKKSVEQDLIQKVLQKNRGNISHTARELGISRPTLYDLLKKYRIAKGLSKY